MYHIKKPTYCPLLLDDVPAAFLTALQEISKQDIAGFYENVTNNYLNMAVNTEMLILFVKFNYS